MKRGESVQSQKVSVMPSRAASVMQAVLGFAFLIFGAVFVFSQAVNVSSSEPELKLLLTLFGIIWIIACGAIAGYGVYCLSKRKPAALFTLEFEHDQLTSEVNGESNSADFDARLRKLESLKKEGLISADEYNRKRTELMMEKW